MKDGVFTHPLQSKQWGEFREKTGIKVVNLNGLQMTVHKIPHTPWAIGYVPKGPLPNKETILELKRIGRQEKCIFIQLEPNVIMNKESRIKNHEEDNQKLIKFQSIIHNSKFMIHPSTHPLFTKFTFILDLTKSEDELLCNMRPKTRYNIKVALKHGVEIIQDNSDEAFENYLKLTEETTKRQGFYAHTQKYHRLMWETLKSQKSKVKSQSLDTDKLTAHLLLANYPNPYPLRPTPLVTWILFVYKDTLYYPYGASSNLHRETMASNLIMWEAIKFGKKLGLKKFDMWGALGPNPDPKDSWYGFHRFKEGYGPKLIEFIGSFDLVINPLLYEIYKIMDKVRWTLLRIKK